MKLKFFTIYITLIFSLVSVYSKGQTDKNENAYIPVNLADCMKHLKEKLHPTVVEKFANVEVDDIGNVESSMEGEYFNGLTAYIDTYWLANKKTKLDNYFILNKLPNPGGYYILRVFISYLNNPKIDLIQSLRKSIPKSKFLPPAFPRENYLEREFSGVTELKFGELLMEGFYINKLDGYGQKVNFAYLEKNGEYEIRSLNLDSIIISELSNVSPFVGYSKDCNNRISTISRRGKSGMINISGEILFDLEYDDISLLSYCEKYISARKNGKYCLFNTNKDMIIDYKYQYFSLIVPTKELNKFVFSVKKDEKIGVVDENDKEIIPLIYDDGGRHLVENKNGKQFLIFGKGKKYGAVDFNNKEIIPFMYNSYSEVIDFSTK
jgi:hypothetical protein